MTSMLRQNKIRVQKIMATSALDGEASFTKEKKIYKIHDNMTVIITVGLCVYILYVRGENVNEKRQKSNR
jgi:uncharacterized membrane protein